MATDHERADRTAPAGVTATVIGTAA